MPFVMYRLSYSWGGGPFYDSRKALIHLLTFIDLSSSFNKEK
jgi:hypothetical protein